jgi:hypothetical protein
MAHWAKLLFLWIKELKKGGFAHNTGVADSDFHLEGGDLIEATGTDILDAGTFSEELFTEKSQLSAS